MAVTNEELKALEKMTRLQLGSYLINAGYTKAAEIVAAQFQKYRKAAAVANVFADYVDGAVGKKALSDRIIFEAKAALADYLPTRFLLARAALDARRVVLEEVYNTAADWDFQQPHGVEKFVDLLFQQVVLLEEAKKHAAE